MAALNSVNKFIEIDIKRVNNIYNSLDDYNKERLFAQYLLKNKIIFNENGVNDIEQKKDCIITELSDGILTNLYMIRSFIEKN